MLSGRDKALTIESRTLCTMLKSWTSEVIREPWKHFKQKGDVVRVIYFS